MNLRKCCLYEQIGIDWGSTSKISCTFPETDTLLQIIRSVRITLKLMSWTLNLIWHVTQSTVNLWDPFASPTLKELELRALLEHPDWTLSIGLSRWYPNGRLEYIGITGFTISKSQL